MTNAHRIDPHQPAAGRVRGDGIVGKDEAAESLHRAVQRAVAFHGLNPVGDYEVDGHRGGKLDDGVVDALPMQNVLGPAVDGAWHDPEEVLQTQSDAGPVMGLDLRHGDDDVGGQHRLRQPEFRQMGQPRRGRHSDDGGEVEIDELGATKGIKLRTQTGLVKQQVGVANVPGAVSDHDGCSSPPVEGIDRRSDQHRVSVDRRRWRVLHEVGLQKHALATNRQR